MRSSARTTRVHRYLTLDDVVSLPRLPSSSCPWIHRTVDDVTSRPLRSLLIFHSADVIVCTFWSLYCQLVFCDHGFFSNFVSKWCACHFPTTQTYLLVLSRASLSGVEIEEADYLCVVSWLCRGQAVWLGGEEPRSKRLSTRLKSSEFTLTMKSLAKRCAFILYLLRGFPISLPPLKEKNLSAALALSCCYTLFFFPSSASCQIVIVKSVVDSITDENASPACSSVFMPSQWPSCSFDLHSCTCHATNVTMQCNNVTLVSG